VRFSANIFGAGISLTSSALIVVSPPLSPSSWYGFANLPVTSLYMLSESFSPKIRRAVGETQACIWQSLNAASVLFYLPLGTIVRLPVEVEYIAYLRVFSSHVETDVIPRYLVQLQEAYVRYTGCMCSGCYALILVAHI